MANNKQAREIALAVLRRLDILMCVEDKSIRVRRAQEEITAITAHALTGEHNEALEQAAAAARLVKEKYDKLVRSDYISVKGQAIGLAVTCLSASAAEVESAIRALITPVKEDGDGK